MKEVFNVARMIIEFEARSPTSSLVTVLGTRIVVVVVEGARLILSKQRNMRSNSLWCRTHT
jgi:hypothetical protein